MSKQTISVLDQQNEIIDFVESPRGENDVHAVGDGVLHFEIISMEGLGNHEVELVIDYGLAHFITAEKKRVMIMRNTTRLSDPNNELQTSLYSMPSTGMLTSLFKANGEMLLKLYTKKVGDFKFLDTAENPHEMTWELAIDITREMLERRKRVN
jgi:hypothetical protein